MSYAEDTLSRISSQTKLTRQYLISVNLLVNDIQIFANLYKKLRTDHKEYFDTDDDD